MSFGVGAEAASTPPEEVATIWKPRPPAGHGRPAGHGLEMSLEPAVSITAADIVAARSLGEE